MEDQQPAAGDLTAEENPAADQNEATVAAAGDDRENGDAATESEAAKTSDAA
ncbi:mammalian cell entry protein, partial [Mycobacterium avium subsp. hominissuis]